MISYTVDGENILVTLSAAQTAASQRSPDVLLGFLLTNKLVSNLAKIQKLDIALPSYTLTVVSNNGTFKAVIDDIGGTMKVSQFTLISTVTCYDMDVSDVQTSDKISTIDSFLKASYPLTDFSIQLVQVNVQTDSVVYRILYANSKLKQI